MRFKLYSVGKRTGELWKTIPSFPDFEASYTGKIRIASTKLPIKEFSSNYYKAYSTVALGQTLARVSRLVYETFIGPLIEGLVIMHLDDNGCNNQVGNLKQGTHKENSHMGFRLRKGTNWATEAESLKLTSLINWGVKVSQSEYTVGKFA